jgi:dimethylaniline monooxygenase (N-oxide forming)
MRKAKRACIIGSGPSGLVACKELVAAGFECAVYEKQSGLGGAFATCYEGFLFTTSTHLSAFSDIPEDKPSRHWSATEFISYCSRYVEHFKLQKHLVFNACVTSVKRKASGQFDVAINNAVESEVFDFVVLCSGLNHAPKAEMIHSSAVHSSTIRDFDQFAGKRVLIVGGGESASDLTLLLMQSGRAKSVCVSVRSAASQGWMVARTYGKNKTPSDVDTVSGCLLLSFYLTFISYFFLCYV